MKDNFSFLTPKQAGDLAGYTARHMLNIIKSGKLSATKDDGNYYIDKAEFFRVFPDAHSKEQAKNQPKTTEDLGRIKTEMESEFLKQTVTDKDKQIDFLKQQLETFGREKGLMLEAINSHSRLLEHKQNTKTKATSSLKKWYEFWK